MKVEQIYTGCLAQGAYYIESEGEVAIVDPLREVQAYLDRAKKDEAEIKYIFETHFHADFVSGHLTLSEKTGAPIVFGPTAEPNFESHIAKDKEVFQLGKVSIIALHTPGHTMESVTYLLRDEKGKDHAIFTGDTLFLGDVGRPDLAQKAGELTQEDLAAMLYDSLRQKIMPLADDVVVYPAHGAGSACGKNMMDETVDTLGNQKKMNYALRENMSKEEFIKEVTDGLMPPPGYFPLNVQMNREGYQSIDEVLKQGLKALSPEEFETAANQTGAVLLDVRHQDEFIKAFVPGSTFIGLDGDFAPWVGALISDVKQPILLIVPQGREEEAITRLSRVGFDHSLGYLKGGIDAWQKAGKETDSMKNVSADEVARKLEHKPAPVIDVRKPGEFSAGHLNEALNIPLDFINEEMNSFPQKEPFYLHCLSGYRSVIAGSILKARGLHHFANVAGGYRALSNEDVAMSQLKEAAG
ncbi:MAG: MBL fold metallo-hydrolase [Owenweeksia sp.]|nr:MBL fold metallo-hydrolase [Owenweeksia sp.]